MSMINIPTKILQQIPKFIPNPLDNIKMNHIFTIKVMKKNNGTYIFPISEENRIDWWWSDL
jgi:hypothetical protein